ncbi:MAG: aspartate/ornithine carbamoyltransferase family protein [Frankia sp.]
MSEVSGFPGHLVSAADLSDTQIGHLFGRASVMRSLPRRDARSLLEGFLLGVLFFQPSTRTKLGFEAAAIRLGAGVTGFADSNTTRSVDYVGETLDDTVRVVSELSDVIVMRHYVAGAGRRASCIASCPVINGGDGSNEHPTQALSDAWLMHERLGGLRGAVVGLVGDPGTRVLRSMVHVLARLRVKQLLFLVPPNAPFRTDCPGFLHTTLPADLRATLDAFGVHYGFRSDVLELLDEADAIEMMPIDIRALEIDPHALTLRQQVTPERFRITASKIHATGSGALILHPGPRKDELHPDVDELPGGLYFEQIPQSVYLRMAVLAQLCVPDELVEGLK